MSPPHRPSGADANPRILQLAPEILENIVKHVINKRDLSSTRLVCQILDKHAAKELFRNVFISPLEKHASAWSSISQSDGIRRIPRRVIIHTQSNIEDHDFEGDEPDDIVENFEDTLAALSRFPNIDSVEIGFSAACVGEREDNWWHDVPEDVSSRKEMLQLIFQAIQDRAADRNNRTIRKLTIINLQNCPISDFTSSGLFRDVTSQLEELHLSITQEYNEHGPDHDYSRVELQTFPDHLCSEWLTPMSANLRALSLYSRSDNWGPFPGFFDARGLSFPKLETLALGYYTLAHDTDLDWVLAIKSLRRLILHSCMIASWVCIENKSMDEWAVRTHDWARMADLPDDTWAAQYRYGGTWSMFLDRIAQDLPNLHDFGFSDTRYGLQYRNSCGARIFPQRYICFDHGILPTHWPEAEDSGELHSWLDEGFPINMHVENLEKDQRSLDHLLMLSTLRGAKL